MPQKWRGTWRGGPYSKHFPERVAARLVREGVLRLDPDGSVWRLKEYPHHGGEPVPIKPRRIDERNKGGYYQFAIRLRKGLRGHVQVSRFIWQMNKGNIPPKLTVNHKDGDKAHNKMCNYELATHSAQHKRRFRVLGHENAGKKNKRLLDQFVYAARSAVAGNLDLLRDALKSYEFEHAK
jgi:hypothetical protein